jgi:hypothetical protein
MSEANEAEGRRAPPPPSRFARHLAPEGEEKTSQSLVAAEGVGYSLDFLRSDA